MVARSVVAQKDRIRVPGLRPCSSEGPERFLILVIGPKRLKVLIAVEPGKIDRPGALDPLDRVLTVLAILVSRIEGDHGFDRIYNAVEVLIAAGGRHDQHQA